jgi:predicted transcriptional regulator
LLSHEGSGAELSATRLPLDEVRDVMARRSNHYPRIEEEAESFFALLKPDGDLSAALKDWLRRSARHHRAHTARRDHAELAQAL